MMGPQKTISLLLIFAILVSAAQSATVIGDVLDPSSCTPACQIGEECTMSATQPTCTGICGDGIVASSELCDDGDSDDMNGCTNLCEVNDGWVCLKAFSVDRYSNDCRYNPIPLCTAYSVSATNVITCATC